MNGKTVTFYPHYLKLPYFAELITSYLHKTYIPVQNFVRSRSEISFLQIRDFAHAPFRVTRSLILRSSR